jgi:hypothetical protein
MAKERHEKGRLLMHTVDELFKDVNLAYVDIYGEQDPEWRESAAELSRLRMEQDMYEAQTVGAFDSEFTESLKTVIETVDRELPQTRSSSAEFSKMVDDLVAVTTEYAQTGFRAAQPENTDTLLTSLEREIEEMHRSRKATMQEPASALEANNALADGIVHALEKHFTDDLGEDFTNLKNNVDIAGALYELRNPPRRSKQ